MAPKVKRQEEKKKKEKKVTPKGNLSSFKGDKYVYQYED